VHQAVGMQQGLQAAVRHPLLLRQDQAQGPPPQVAQAPAQLHRLQQPPPTSTSCPPPWLHSSEPRHPLSSPLVPVSCCTLVGCLVQRPPAQVAHLTWHPCWGHWAHSPGVCQGACL
jgi:hypothetical protein